MSLDWNTYRNPLFLASGTCGFGQELEDFGDLAELGGLFTKAVTPEARPGNPMPRLAETKHGLLNSIGLANPGLDAFLDQKLPWLRQQDCAVFINVAGRTKDDYLRVCQALQDAEQAWSGPEKGKLAGIELNVSCPNVKQGGISFGARPEALEDLTRAVRDIWKGALVVKLTPQVSSVPEMARAAEASGADALSLINTIPGMAIDLKSRRPKTITNTSGYSGPAIKPVAIAQVWQAACAVSIPLFGIGGIQDTEDVVEFLLAGASAVQVGTSSFADPRRAWKLVSGLAEWLDREGVKDVRELVGAVRPWQS